MKRVFTSAIVMLMLTLGAIAQTPPPDGVELTRLLNEFLAGASRNDAAIHDRFWAEDVIYTGSAGRRRGKADIMHDVRSAPAPKPGDPTTAFTAEDVRIQQYGNTAIVAFRLVGTTVKDTKTDVMNYLNSGTFVKRNGKWQVVNWQSTRMPLTEKESKSEVTTAAAAFHDAIFSANIDKLTALTDQTFVWTHGSVKSTSQQLFDDLRAKKVKYVKPDPAKASISVYGDTAIVRGESYTLIFINRLGVWRAVAL